MDTMESQKDKRCHLQGGSFLYFEGSWAFSLVSFFFFFSLLVLDSKASERYLGWVAADGQGERRGLRMVWKKHYAFQLFFLPSKTLVLHSSATFPD